MSSIPTAGEALLAVLAGMLKWQLLPADSRTLLVNAFPAMHSRDWKALMDQADVQTYSRGSVILDVGQSTTNLKLIVAGVEKSTAEQLQGTAKKGPFGVN